MKKVLLLLLFVSGAATLVSAQQKFHINIDTIFISSPSAPYYIGEKVTVTIHLTNDGAFPVKNGSYQPDSLPPGTYYFNYNAGVGTVSENKTDYYHPIYLNGIGYLVTESVTDTLTLSAAFFQGGKNNIVIIWPSGAKAVGNTDSLDTVPKNQCTLFISATAGIIPGSVQNSFKIYPNPAKDVVNIQMNEAGTGMIRLMDMTGKLIASKPYSSKAGENISLPLNEGANIPDGLYLVSIETANSSSVNKIMICR